MVAVDLGGSGIRAVQFTSGKGVPTVTKVGYQPLPDGAVVGGEVANVEEVGNALKALWAREKFRSKQVVFGLSNGNVLVRIKNLDWDLDADFRKSLKYQPGVADELPFDIEDANLDFHTLYEYTHEIDGEDKRFKQILLVAATKQMVDGFVEALRHAGLQPVAADLTPFALIRALTPAGAVANPETIEVLIDMGLDVTNVVLHQGGQPRFVRMVNGQAGRTLTRTLGEQFNWPVEDAERTKVELGLTGGVSADGQQHPAQQVINHLVSAFIAEMHQSIDYFLSSSPQVQSVSRVVLTGGGAHLKGLRERIASELRVPVEVGLPERTVTLGKGVTIPEGLTEAQLAVAFGLATTEKV